MLGAVLVEEKRRKILNTSKSQLGVLLTPELALELTIRLTHKKLFGALQFPKYYQSQLQQFLIGIFWFKFIYKQWASP